MHRLSKVRPEERLGDCEECGPDARLNVKTYPSGRQGWRCTRASRPTPELRAQQKRRTRLKRYGLTPDQADALGDCCAICGRTNADRRLAIDHDHDTGRVRGRLCTACNRGLGYFGDDPERLLAAVAYLRSGVPSVLPRRSAP